MTQLSHAPCQVRVRDCEQPRRALVVVKHSMEEACDVEERWGEQREKPGKQVQAH